MTGHVYVIDRGDGTIKIGMSANPTSRIYAIQNEHKFIAVNLYVTENIRLYSEVEKAAHKLLDSHRIGGEWFKCSIEEGKDAVDEAIKLCSGMKPKKSMRATTLAPIRISKAEKRHLLKKAKLTNGGTIREALRELIQSDMEKVKK